ncbi:MAG: hypothetical protein ACT4QD_21925 [Acidobacteriota bacterium]
MTPPAFPLGRLVLAGALFAAGGASWVGATIARDLADAHERLATFDYASPPSDHSDSVPRRAVEAALDPSAWLRPTVSHYWAGRYEALLATAGGSAQDDALSMLIAANANYRRSQREAGGRPMSVERLDQSLQAYASALRNAGYSQDAAYNFEYIARLRDTAARARPAARPGPALPAAPPAPPSIWPSGPTIHGRPGRHPTPTRGEEFDVLTPMDYGDREAQPEPTPGRKLPRKG